MNRIDLLRELGVEVYHETDWRGTPGVDREEFELPDKVRGVRPNFTPEQWCSLAMREGSSYVGGCCGNMSALQDTINMVFRDGGFIDAADLLEIAGWAHGHDGFELFGSMDDETFERKVETAKHFREQIDGREVMVDPWALLGLIYNGVEPMLTPNSTNVPGDGGRAADTEHYDVAVLERTLMRMTWADLFDREGDELAQHEANMQVLRARALPVMRSLVARMEESGVDFDGWAIVNPETDEVLSNGRGLCLYPEREQAEQVVEQWSRWADEERERLAKDPKRKESLAFWDGRASEIVRATVTVGDGLKVVRN